MVQPRGDRGQFISAKPPEAQQPWREQWNADQKEPSTENPEDAMIAAIDAQRAAEQERAEGMYDFTDAGVDMAHDEPVSYEMALEKDRPWLAVGKLRSVDENGKDKANPFYEEEELTEVDRYDGDEITIPARGLRKSKQVRGIEKDYHLRGDRHGDKPQKPAGDRKTLRGEDAEWGRDLDPTPAFTFSEGDRLKPVPSREQQEKQELVDGRAWLSLSDLRKGWNDEKTHDLPEMTFGEDDYDDGGYDDDLPKHEGMRQQAYQDVRPHRTWFGGGGPKMNRKQSPEDIKKTWRNYRGENGKGLVYSGPADLMKNEASRPIGDDGLTREVDTTAYTRVDKRRLRNPKRHAKGGKKRRDFNRRDSIRHMPPQEVNVATPEEQKRARASWDAWLGSQETTKESLPPSVEVKPPQERFDNAWPEEYRMG